MARQNDDDRPRFVYSCSECGERVTIASTSPELLIRFMSCPECGTSDWDRVYE